MSELAAQLEVVASLGSWERSEETKALVLDGFRSPDAAVRVLALEVAAQEMDDDLAVEVARLLDTDPDVEVRGLAALTLGPALEEMNSEDDWEGPDLGGLPMSVALFQAIESRLEGIYRDAGEPKEVRRRALEAAVRSPRPWQRAAIRLAWASDDPEWRLTAVFSMGCLSGFKAEILEALESDSAELKVEAMRAIGGQGIEEVGDELVSLVASHQTPHELRLAAIYALATVRPAGGEEVLESLLQTDDEEIAEAAREALDELQMWQAGDGPGCDEELSDISS